MKWKTVAVGGISPEHLELIINRRIEHARRSEGPMPRLANGASRVLIERFGDDVRAIEHYLYGRFQELEVIGDVTV